MEPEQSRARIISTPLASIVELLRPSCGRASPMMMKPSARRLSVLIQRPARLRVSRATCRAISALEYFTAATVPRLPRRSAIRGSRASSQRS